MLGRSLNWLVILPVVALGAALGYVSTLGLSGAREALLWGAAALAASAWFARTTPERPAVHGFVAGFLAGALAPVVQAVLFANAAQNNPQAIEAMFQAPNEFAARLLVLVLAPVIALLSGILLAVLAWGASKVPGLRRAHA